MKLENSIQEDRWGGGQAVRALKVGKSSLPLWVPKRLHGETNMVTNRNLHDQLLSFKRIASKYRDEWRGLYFYYVVRASGRLVRAPRTLPPKSGKVSCPGKGLTFPSTSTWIGYFRRWPCNGK